MDAAYRAKMRQEARPYCVLPLIFRAFPVFRGPKKILLFAVVRISHEVKNDQFHR